MELLGKIVKENEARPSFEGEEFCRNYFQTDRITFGMSVLRSGCIGALDPGHQEADEVFFCVQGRVLCYFPEDDHYYPLEKGDALLIPPKTGHKLYNIGEETAVVTWSCAPKP
jgi:mannose-6-phosphate isomerase-like protein (cupin superfamily)